MIPNEKEAVTPKLRLCSLSILQTLLRLRQASACTRAPMYGAHLGLRSRRSDLSLGHCGFVIEFVLKGQEWVPG